MNVPQLRFSEFSGEWEENNLEKFCYKIASGKSKQNDEGKYNLYGSTGIIGKTNEYSNDGKFILIARVGANAGLTNIVEGCFGVTDNTLVVDLKDEVDKDFILSLLHKYNLNKLIFGSGQPLITGGQLKSLKLSFPKKPEQEKIASFLTSVDTKIEQLTKKEALLQEYKKGVMAQIFNQEIRFKDDDGSEFCDWEEKIIDKLPICISDGNYGELYPTSEDFKTTGTPFLRANNIKNLKIDDSDTKYISEKQHSTLTSGHLVTNDILITTRGELGNIALIDEKHNGSNINAQICLLRVTDKSKLYYLYLLYILDYRDSKKQYKAFETGTALKQLPKGNLKKIIIKIPCLEEQTKIANFLSSIDSKIEQVQKQLNSTKEFKKALLQQMFV